MSLILLFEIRMVCSSWGWYLFAHWRPVVPSVLSNTCQGSASSRPLSCPLLQQLWSKSCCLWGPEGLLGAFTRYRDLSAKRRDCSPKEAQMAQHHRQQEQHLEHHSAHPFCQVSLPLELGQLRCFDSENHGGHLLSAEYVIEVSPLLGATHLCKKVSTCCKKKRKSKSHKKRKKQ